MYQQEAIDWDQTLTESYFETFLRLESGLEEKLLLENLSKIDSRIKNYICVRAHISAQRQLHR